MMAGKVVKQLAGSGTGQSFMDRVNAAKHSISGSGLGKSVCKATTEEIAAPKKKHLEYLIQCTHEPNVSIPDLADILIARCQSSSWVIVFKGLITIHNLMNLGNDRFSQYIASNNCQLSLPNFTDKTTVQGYDMSIFIRKYSCYVNEKVESYRLMAFDFCKVKRGKEGVLRTIASDKLMKALPVLQKQLDVLLEFEASTNELTNQVINAAFLLLYKDLIRLFASYNEGMINLIERYFTMNKKQCRDGLTLYKNFVQRMEKVTSFLKTAETMGIGDKESLGLTPMPESVWDAMEQHLANLEGRKYVKTSPLADVESSNKGTSSTVATDNQSSPIKTVEITGEPAESPMEEAADINFTPISSAAEAERKRIIEVETQRLEEFAAKSNAAAQRSNSPFELTPKGGTTTVRIQQKPAVSRVISTTTTPDAAAVTLQHDDFADFNLHVASIPSPTEGGHTALPPVSPAKSPLPPAMASQQPAISKPSPNQDLLLLGFDNEPTVSTTPASASTGWADSSSGGALLDVDFTSSYQQPSPKKEMPSKPAQDMMMDLLDLGDAPTQAAIPIQNTKPVAVAASALDDILGLDDVLSAPTVTPSTTPMQPMTGSSQNKNEGGFDIFQSLLEPSPSKSSGNFVMNSTPSMGVYLSQGGTNMSGSLQQQQQQQRQSSPQPMMMMGGSGSTITPAIASVSNSASKKPFSASNNLDETLASLAGSLSLGGSGSTATNKWTNNQQRSASPMMSASRPMGTGASTPMGTNINWNSGNSPATSNSRPISMPMMSYNPFISPLMYSHPSNTVTTASQNHTTPWNQCSYNTTANFDFWKSDFTSETIRSFDWTQHFSSNLANSNTAFMSNSTTTTSAPNNSPAVNDPFGLM